MPEYYYQIKRKRLESETDYFGTSNWGFPPVFSGKVEAVDKKLAKNIIDEDYGKKFPLRVLSKDIDSNEFLLSIEEIKEGSHIQRLFEKQSCTHCQNTFYVIDKYNDPNVDNKSFDFCSDKCKSDHRGVQSYLRNQYPE